MQPTTFTYFDYCDIPLQATFYSAAKNQKNTTIIYIHGGGLIYGERDDLPNMYKKMFLDAGYDLLTIDYPLAPETQLPDILECLFRAIEWFVEHALATLALKSSDYVLFGRSAGAYLAFLLTAKKILPPPPRGLISFYGYYSLEEPSFSRASDYYNQFPTVPESYVKQLTAIWTSRKQFY